MDLEAGDQPLKSADGDVVLVFNGEIFNHRELRAQLESCGAFFQTHCDTEVVLQAFLRWGTACFAKFRGMFALALWIQSERRLILVRDRMGIKPLYYYRHENDIFFGSELKCILAHPEVRRRICPEALDTYLSLNYVPGPFTMIADIVKLMPGEMLDWRRGRTRITEYATPAESHRDSEPKTIDEAAEQLDDLLKSSVREQLVSDRPVGVWLSGGLDSSTVLHYANQASARPVKTFSITFRGLSGDESRHIQQVSSHFGTQHSEFDVNPALDLEGAIEQMIYHSDEPSADAGALPTWFLSRFTRQSATVALSGEGSDELFAGYLTYKADRYNAMWQRVPRLLRSAAHRLACSLPAADGRISFEYKLKRFLEGSLLSPAAAHLFWNGTFSAAEKLRICPSADGSSMADLVRSLGRRPNLEKFLALDQRYYLADDILYKVDRMSMAHSLEVRPPFLDPRIVDFAASLPASFKLKGRTTKRVLRHLMAGKLPEQVLRRPKVGFDIPIHEWFRGSLRPLLLETVTRESVERSGLFRWTPVEAMIRRHMERKENAGYQLWGFMLLLMWMKRWNVESIAEAQEPTLETVLDLDPVGSLQQQLALSSS